MAEGGAVYSEDEFLALSGVQHFAFCRRQWALIHIEQAWADNALTMQGIVMHDRAHDDEVRERRGDRIIVRGLRVHSAELGLSGICDVVEFHRCATGHPLSGEEGLWRAVPIEYKRGKSKPGNEDRLQLCAQAVCLEEMLGTDIPTGYLYYGETKSREEVALAESLRDQLNSAVEEMHRLYERGHTPRVGSFGGCGSCSLREQCVPKLPKRDSVSDYIVRNLEDSL